MAHTSARIRILILHDEPLLHAGLAALCAAAPDMEVVPPAPHRVGTRPACDVVVADLAQALDAAGGAARVVAVTGALRERDIRGAFEAGVLGYLQPSCAVDELLQAVRLAHRGARHLGPEAAARLADSFARDHLTPREEAVLALVVEGLSNKSIAQRLDIALGTVKAHLKGAFAKLGVRGRTEAVVVAERRGLLHEGATAPADAPARAA